MSLNHSPCFPVEEFIKAVMQKPHLWQLKHPEHKNKRLLKKAWDEIVQKFDDYNVDDLKKKWRYFRDQYRKELRKNVTPKSGDSSPEIGLSQWKYYDLLSFLKDEIILSSGDSNFITINTEYDDDSGDNSSPFHNAPCSHTDPISTAVRETRKRTANDIRTDFFEIEKKRLHQMEREIHTNGDNKSQDYHFLMSLLPQLESFTPTQRYRVRNKINMAILEELNDSEPYSSSKSSVPDDQPDHHESKLILK